MAKQRMEGLTLTTNSCQLFHLCCHFKNYSKIQTKLQRQVECDRANTEHHSPFVSIYYKFYLQDLLLSGEFTHFSAT